MSARYRKILVGGIERDSTEMGGEPRRKNISRARALVHVQNYFTETSVSGNAMSDFSRLMALLTLRETLDGDISILAICRFLYEQHLEYQR